MNITAVRLACAICLLLVVLGALASKAAAHGPGWVNVAVTPHATSTPANPAPTVNSSDSFDWTDASVGAAFGVLLVPLLVGGVLLLNRGWVNAQLPARSRPR